MANFYSPKEKAHAIQSLVENMGNTRRVAEETGITERTLQRWRNEYSPQTILMTNDSEEAAEALVRENIIQIRNDTIEHIQNISQKMRDNPEAAADLAMDFVRLVNGLVKAEQLASARTFQLVILWEDRDGFIRELSDDIPF